MTRGNRPDGTLSSKGRRREVGTVRRNEEQHRTLSQKLRGHYAYYGVTGNGRSLGRIWHETTRIWRKWLCRRSQKGFLSWAKMFRLLERYPLPPPRIVHQYGT